MSIGLNLGGGADDELKKQQADLQLFKDLVDQGIPQDQATYMVQQRRKTGQLDTTLPNFQNDLQKSTQPNRPVPLPPVPDIPERSTLQNFSTPVSKNVGQDIYVDASNGHEIRREPNGSKSNRIIKVGAAGGGGAGGPKETPAQKAAMAYMKGHFKAIQDGTADPNDPILPSAAKALGMDVTDIPSIDNPTPNQTFIQKVFGITPETPPPTPGKTIPVFNGGNNGVPKPAQPAQSDAQKRAADFLTQHGQKATPANIDHAIKAGWVK
jgi:hypothetical protein